MTEMKTYEAIIHADRKKPGDILQGGSAVFRQRVEMRAESEEKAEEEALHIMARLAASPVITGQPRLSVLREVGR